jgi:hypothetical protein
MAKRKPANEEDFGFEPIKKPSDSEDIGFTPEEAKAAESKMAKAAFPTAKTGTVPSEDFGFEPEDPNLTPVDAGEALQDAFTTLPQGVTTWADEIQAAAQATGKKALGNEVPWADIYEEDVANIRQKVGEARERSPWATTIGEMGAGAASSFIPGLKAITGAGKYSGGLEMIGRSAFEGLGTAEDKMGVDGLVQAGLGAALGTGGALASGALKRVSTEDPNVIRANVLGARTSEFKEVGIKDREEIAKKLNELGFFKKDKLEFDVDKMKFVSKGKSLENLQKPTRKILVERLKNAEDKIKLKKEAILGGKVNTPVDLDKIQEKLLDAADEFATKGLGSEEKFAQAEAVKNVIVKDIENEMERLGVDIPTVGVLEEVKNKISNELESIGKNPLLAKIPESADIYKRMYGTINDYLRDKLKLTSYTDLNKTQSMMITAKIDLLKAMAAEDATVAQAGWGGWFNKVLNETLGTPEAGLGMARAAEIANYPVLKQMKNPLRIATEEAPFAAMRFLDPSIPMPSQQIPYRSPQSIGFSPMEIVKFKIPRTTQAVMENKDKVLAKLVQSGADPMIIDSITEGLNGSGEEISKVMPLLITQMPTLFENSKYKTYDGKFLDPSDSAKAADDISKREDLSSIERAKMINKINKRNEVPEGL